MDKLKIKFDIKTCNIEGVYPLEDSNEIELYEAKVKINALLNINKKGELVENPYIEIEEFELTYYEQKCVLIRAATYHNPAEWEWVEVRKIIISREEGFEIIPNEEWSISFNDLINGCTYINVDMDDMKVYL